MISGTYSDPDGSVRNPVRRQRHMLWILACLDLIIPSPCSLSYHMVLESWGDGNAPRAIGVAS